MAWRITISDKKTVYFQPPTSPSVSDDDHRGNEYDKPDAGLENSALADIEYSIISANRENEEQNPAKAIAKNIKEQIDTYRLYVPDDQVSEGVSQHYFRADGGASSGTPTFLLSSWNRG